MKDLIDIDGSADVSKFTGPMDPCFHMTQADINNAKIKAIRAKSRASEADIRWLCDELEQAIRRNEWLATELSVTQAKLEVATY